MIDLEVVNKKYCKMIEFYNTWLEVVKEDYKSGEEAEVKSKIGKFEDGFGRKINSVSFLETSNWLNKQLNNEVKDVEDNLTYIGEQIFDYENLNFANFLEGNMFGKFFSDTNTRDNQKDWIKKGRYIEEYVKVHAGMEGERRKIIQKEIDSDFLSNLEDNQEVERYQEVKSKLEKLLETKGGKGLGWILETSGGKLKNESDNLSNGPKIFSNETINALRKVLRGIEGELKTSREKHTKLKEEIHENATFSMKELDGLLKEENKIISETNRENILQAAVVQNETVCFSLVQKSIDK